VLAARLDFTIDPPVIDAIRRHAPEIARSAPARMIEELYKILRSGASERAFRELADVGLLQWVAPELLQAQGNDLWTSLAELDRYRHRFATVPESLTNSVLLGTLLVPCGFTGRHAFRPDPPSPAERETASGRRRRARDDWHDPKAVLGALPLARRDVERLRQVLGLQRRLLDMQASPRAKRAVMSRGPFSEALVWLDVHGHVPDIVEHWRGFVEAMGVTAPADTEDGERPPRRRRRRRRRGYNREARD
jgi:poly(A) polymerase